MRKILVTSSAILVSALALAQAPPPNPSPSPATTPVNTAPDRSQHLVINPNALKWGPPPPAFEKGPTFTVVSGDPGKPGPFTVRMRMPQGFKIKPHYHPTDENITVLAGEFAMGMGDTFDPAKMQSLTMGGYALMPAQMHHYAMAKTAATIQVHGIGPFSLTYINPADDPRTRAAAPPAKK